jgi:hypothetical protein
MSTVVSNTSVFTNREFPFKKIAVSDKLEKRNRKYYIDYTIDEQPIFFQINKVVLSSEPIFIDEEQGYIDVEIKDRLLEISKFFEELDNFNQISCFKNCEEWLGKNITIQELECVYKTSFKNNLLRLKIERDNISIFDLKKNKLNLDKDIKVGNILDIIVEISGLKVMKNSFAAHLVLRQIRKHPEQIQLKKNIPTEYLFIDDYSNRNNKNINDRSLDSQTDVDVLVTQRKKRNVVTKIQKENIKQTVEVNELDVSLSELKDPGDIHIPESVYKNEQKIPKINNLQPTSFDIEKEDDNTNDYLQSVEKLKNIMSGILDDKSSNIRSDETSRKDKILDKLETGEITLGSMISDISEKAPKKISGRKKGPSKNTKSINQELYKDL